jgi:hypothetical protein
MTMMYYLLKHNKVNTFYDAAKASAREVFANSLKRDLQKKRNCQVEVILQENSKKYMEVLRHLHQRRHPMVSVDSTAYGGESHVRMPVIGRKAQAVHVADSERNPQISKWYGIT